MNKRDLYTMKISIGSCNDNQGLNKTNMDLREF